MREINIVPWKTKDQKGNEMEESLLTLLSVLVTSKKPDEIPHGFVGFKLFRKLVKSFEKAEETKVLILEEDSYMFLRNLIEKDIPANWAGSLPIYEAITLFMENKGD